MPLKLIRRSIFDVPVALIEETNERANKSAFYVLHQGCIPLVHDRHLRQNRLVCVHVDIIKNLDYTQESKRNLVSSVNSCYWTTSSDAVSFGWNRTTSLPSTALLQLIPPHGGTVLLGAVPSHTDLPLLLQALHFIRVKIIFYKQ
jgi:hypothetical protein